MPKLHRDFETYSAIDLPSAGAWRYAADSTTGVHCVAYAVDAGPVSIWLPGQPIPQEFFAAATEPDWLAIAHNDPFEAAIEERVLAPRYGWPVIPLERHRCTAAAALAAALPGRLEHVAEALDLPFKKDREGYKLMRKLAQRRELPTPGELDILAAYCANDVEIERALDHVVPPLSPAEQALWQLDFEINRRGFHVDRDLAVAARKLAAEEQAAVNRAIAVLTEGKITTANQVKRIRAFVEERGHALKSLAKRSVSAVLAHDPEQKVRQMLELRRDGSRAAARKLDALLAGIGDDARLRDCFRFHGAATGRWSGSRFQPQNLKKAEFKDSDAAIDAILAADLERVRELGAPLAIIGDVTRAIICAPPSRVLIGADFSAIEIAGAGLDRRRNLESRGLPAIRRDPRSRAGTLLRDGLEDFAALRDAGGRGRPRYRQNLRLGLRLWRRPRRLSALRFERHTQRCRGRKVQDGVAQRPPRHDPVLAPLGKRPEARAAPARARRARQSRLRGSRWHALPDAAERPPAELSGAAKSSRASIQTRPSWCSRTMQRAAGATCAVGMVSLSRMSLPASRATF